MSDLDYAKANFDDDLIDDSFIIDSEVLQYVSGDTSAQAITNNVDLLALQGWMVNEIKSRWPSMKVFWYNQYHIKQPSGDEAIKSKWEVSPHTCSVTPGDGWTSTMYREVSPYNYTESSVEQTADYAKLHHVLEGMVWVAPGYASDYRDESTTAKFASEDFAPTPQIWYFSGRRLVNDWWAADINTRDDRFWEWRRLCEGAIIYPPPGNSGFGDSLLQYDYFYAYCIGLLDRAYTAP